jgi:hypothetical protein
VSDNIKRKLLAKGNRLYMVVVKDKGVRIVDADRYDVMFDRRNCTRKTLDRVIANLPSDGPLSPILRARQMADSGDGPEQYVGYLVKREFPCLDGVRSENMWCEVVRVDGERLVGRLRNQPLFATYVHPGEEVDIEVREIIAVDVGRAA